MSLRIRPAVAAAAAALTLATGGAVAFASSGAPASKSVPSATSHGSAAALPPAPSPSLKQDVAPTSALCRILTPTAARTVAADMTSRAVTAPVKGQAPDICLYADAKQNLLLSLMPTSRPYTTEAAVARQASANPSTAQMSSVTVRPVDALGDAAFSERDLTQDGTQAVVFVVWHTGAKSWVLTLSSTAQGPDRTAQTVALARRLAAQLPTP